MNDIDFYNMENNEYEDVIFTDCSFKGTTKTALFDNCKFVNCVFEGEIAFCSFYDCEWDDNCDLEKAHFHKTYIDGKIF